VGSMVWGVVLGKSEYVQKSKVEEGTYTSVSPSNLARLVGRGISSSSGSVKCSLY
jgi:hypothetical protein